MINVTSVYWKDQKHQDDIRRTPSLSSAQVECCEML